MKMKLRAYLLLANGVSIGIILASLFVCYRFMLLSWPKTVLLVSVTLGAAAVSFGVHFVLTRRLESSLHRLTEATQRVAEGRFEGDVPVAGPLEFRLLAGSFNDMAGKLNDSFERLRTSEASRRELVANVSHDLRTPMASIQSFVEALQDEVVQDKITFERYLRTIRSETQRLGGLVEALFELSRLHGGAVAFRPELCHADSLIVDTLHSLELQLEEKALEVEARIPDHLPPLLAMPYELKRVLANLLQNAIRHSPAGGKIAIDAVAMSGEIDPGGSKSGSGGVVSAAAAAAEGSRRDGVPPSGPGAGRDRGDRVLIAVSDEGEGLAAEDAARVFERFYRADRARTRAGGGAGLGLAIARSIIEMHGGEIGVESRPGEGSRFWFTVPVAGDG